MPAPSPTVRDSFFLSVVPSYVYPFTSLLNSYEAVASPTSYAFYTGSKRQLPKRPEIAVLLYAVSKPSSS